MKRSAWIIILLLLIIVILVWWFWPSSSLKKGVSQVSPEVDVTAVNIYDIGDDRIKLSTQIILKNPLPLEITTNKLAYEVYIDSVKVVQSSYSKPIKIGSSSEETIEVPMEILAGPLKQVLDKFEKENQDSADYTMKSSFEVDVPIAGQRKFKMNITRRLPAFRIPTGKPEQIDIDKLGFKESSLDMALVIDNKNVFPLKLKNGKYSVSIDNDLEMEGIFENYIEIPAKGNAAVPMHLVIKTAKFSKLLWKTLFDKKDTKFVIKFSGKLDTDNKLLQNSNIAMRISGTLDELKKVKDQL